MSAKFQSKGEKDLFDQLQSADREIRKKTKILLPNIKKNINLSYENIIFIAIGFVMSCIILFSFGVEKGKRDAALTTAGNEKKIAFTEIEGAAIVEDHSTGYVVQLAAFNKRSSAEEEQGRLQKQGYRAEIRQSGSYYQLYVEGFQSMEKAQKAKNDLKEMYKDCYIKTL
ncbi:MAG: SPOR domain-containing protein [Candidatus Omnitrophica bacterium]|nr:SPOR domain-containing protein [Candidatus Omnitrophota bacterium]